MLSNETIFHKRLKCLILYEMKKLTGYLELRLFKTQENATFIFEISFYSGFPKETPELKFRLRFFFVQPQFAIL